jgi:hypothetical protein
LHFEYLGVKVHVDDSLSDSSVLSDSRHVPQGQIFLGLNACWIDGSCNNLWLNSHIIFPSGVSGDDNSLFIMRVMITYDFFSGESEDGRGFADSTKALEDNNVFSLLISEWIDDFS